MFINFLDTSGFEFIINKNNIISIEKLNNLDIFEIDLDNGQHIWIDVNTYFEIKKLIV